MNEEWGKETIAAFWSKVDIKKPSECWPWLGASKKKGYGNLTVNKKNWLSHRFAWELTNFPIPEGYVVMHLCDCPSCANPSHLVLGTSQANNCDMLIKGRQNWHENRAIGERNANTKLTAEKVREIRKLYQGGIQNQYQLARTYGVTQTNIGSITRNKTWRHVK